METQNGKRDALKSAALKMKYVLLILGILPIFFMVLELVLAFLMKPESLESTRSVPSKVSILAILALVSILSVTVEPIVDRYRETDKKLYFRADAATCSPDVYEYLEGNKVLYAIRIKSNNRPYDQGQGRKPLPQDGLLRWRRWRSPRRCL